MTFLDKKTNRRTPNSADFSLDNTFSYYVLRASYFQTAHFSGQIKCGQVGGPSEICIR